MRIIEPKQIKRSKKSGKYKNFKPITILLLLVIFGLSVGAVAYALPTPQLKSMVTLSEIPGQQIDIAWPNYGQSALGASGYGLLAQTKVAQPAPIASVAKVVTALALLNVKPLKSGEAGPIITLNDSDVRIYNDYASKNGSVVTVVSGETITEKQALEAMLLPSANNMARQLKTSILV